MELHDWLDIILEYLKVLAWPAIVLTLALIFRRPLIDIFKRLQKASGWGAQLELRQEIREVADDSSTTPEAIAETAEAIAETADAAADPSPPEPAQQPGKKPTTPAGRAIRDIHGRDGKYTQATIKAGRAAAETILASPLKRKEYRARMLITWYELEEVVERLGQHYGLPKGMRRVHTLVRHLSSIGHISQELESVAIRLTMLRDRLEDGAWEDLTPQAAEDFIVAARNIQTALERDEKRYFSGDSDTTSPN